MLMDLWISCRNFYKLKDAFGIRFIHDNPACYPELEETAMPSVAEAEAEYN